MESELKRNERTCPLTTPGKKCVDGIREDFEAGAPKCRWWTHVAGKDPQSEKMFDFGDCAMAWVPTVVLEASQMTRQNTATVQELRNETHEGLQKLGSGLKQAAIAIGEVIKQNEELIQGVPLPSIENKENNGHEN